MAKSKIRKKRKKGVPAKLIGTVRFNFNSWHYRNRIAFSKTGIILNKNGAPTIYYK